MARLLRYLANDGNYPDTILDNPFVRRQLDDVLVGAICSLASGYNELEYQTPCLGNAELVHRAEAYLEAHAARSVLISDVVQACDCSRRTLFATFRSYRGYTPLEFLLRIRLRMARVALMNADESKTVASIALACGFTHMGRFAGAYRKQFGERPSETMRRKQRWG